MCPYPCVRVGRWRWGLRGSPSLDALPNSLPHDALLEVEYSACSHLA
jgi:hypothetical protein